MSQTALLPKRSDQSSQRKHGARVRAVRAEANPLLFPENQKVSPRAGGILDSRLAPYLAPYALWALRLAVGAMFLQHVMRMVFGYEPADTSQLFGLPAGVSPLAIGWEAIIGLALIYGFWPRLAAIAGAATLTVATIAAHGVSASPYGWQMPVLWTVALLAVAVAGDGAFALLPSRFRTEHHK